MNEFVLSFECITDYIDFKIPALFSTSMEFHICIRKKRRFIEDTRLRFIILPR